MLFPQVPLGEWLEQYPELEVEKDVCDECEGELIANIPFIQPGVRGLISPLCSCGKSTTRVVDAQIVDSTKLEEFE